MGLMGITPNKPTSVNIQDILGNKGAEIEKGLK